MPTWRVQLWHNNIPWDNSGFTRALLLPLFLLWAFTIWLIGKDPDAWKVWRREEKGTTEDEMVGWHHWLDGHEFEQALGVGDGQGSLVCCGSWGCTVGHDWATELTESSPFVVILEPHKIKSFTVSMVSPSICHEVMGQMLCS